MKKTIFTAVVSCLCLTLAWVDSINAQPQEYYSTIEKALNNFETTPNETPVNRDVQNVVIEKLASDLPTPGPTDTKPEALGEIKESPIVEEGAQALEQPSASTAEVPQTSQLKPQDQTIMLDVLELKDIDISDVLKLISKKSGLNIIKGGDVRGKVTIYLKNVDVRDALRIILESNGLAYSEEGNIIRVMTDKEYEMAFGHKFGAKTEMKVIPLKYASSADMVALLMQVKSIVGKVIADEKSNTLVLMDTPDVLKAMQGLIKEIDIPIDTKVFDLNYAVAEELSTKVSEVLTKNVGTIRFDARSNKMIATDTPQKLQQIAEIVKAFDEKHTEVLIEAKIAQIVLSDQYKMGVDWEAIVSNFHTLDLNSEFSILSSTDKKGRLSIGTLAKDDYAVLLEALDTVGTTNILSSPRISVVNNKEAKILVGSTEPYITTTTTTPATGASTTAESVNFIDVGVKLYVTPTIHKDNYVTMKIKPEVSSVTRFLTTGNNNTIPVVETSQAETTVMVKDGVTIVIGGLIKDEKVATINKIPFLGDIPFLGVAFRNKDNFIRKTEIVIFLTPQIITGDVQSDTKLKLSRDKKL